MVSEKSSSSKASFWSTLPGILTGLATLITAVGGLIIVIRGSEKPVVVDQPPSQVAPSGAQTQPPTSAVNPSSFTVQYLSDLQEKDDGSADRIHGGLQKDKVYWQDEVWMGNSRFHKTLGMHAPSGNGASVSYEVPLGASWFKGLVGLAREDGSDKCKGSATFRVLLNGTSVAKGELRGTWQRPPHDVVVPVAAGQLITLEVTDGGNGYECDTLTWGNPRFEG